MHFYFAYSFPSVLFSLSWAFYFEPFCSFASAFALCLLSPPHVCFHIFIPLQFIYIYLRNILSVLHAPLFLCMSLCSFLAPCFSYLLSSRRPSLTNPTVLTPPTSPAGTRVSAPLQVQATNARALAQRQQQDCERVTQENAHVSIPGLLCCFLLLHLQLILCAQ